MAKAIIRLACNQVHWRCPTAFSHLLTDVLCARVPIEWLSANDNVVNDDDDDGRHDGCLLRSCSQTIPCFKTASKLLGNCSETAWKLLGNCLETAWKLLWNCSETAPKLPQKYSKTAPKLLRNCSETAPKLLWNCLETTAWKLLLGNYCSETTAPKLLWNCYETALKLL